MEVNRHFQCEEGEPRSLGITERKPKHPQFAIITKRHESFRTWPQHLPVSADELAECGFVYTGCDDSVRCYYCGGGLKNWEAGDDPWQEHITWYPDCPHVLLSKGQRFVDRFSSDSDGGMEDDALESDGPLMGTEATHQSDGYLETIAAQSCLQMGYSEDSVQRAIEKYISVHGNSNFKGEDLCGILLDEEEEEQKSRDSTRVSANVTDAVQTPVVLDQYPVSETMEETRNESMEELYEENCRLKDNQQCKICLSAPASIIFLPCGHMVTCPQCAPAFSKCAICRLPVSGFVKAYFVSS